jgi:hypothetical protein
MIHKSRPLACSESELTSKGKIPFRHSSMITHKIRTYPCLECAPKNTCTLDSAATGIGPILLMKAIYLYIQIEVFWVVTP